MSLELSEIKRLKISILNEIELAGIAETTVALIFKWLLYLNQ